MWEVRVLLMLVCYIASFDCMESSQKTIDCPPKFYRFQAANNTEYYECEDGKATVKKCEGGTIYIPYELKCMSISRKRTKRDTSTSKDSSSATKPTTIIQQLLGQSATLGSLYSSKNDQYYIAKNLWKAKNVEASKLKINKKYSNNKYFAGKTSADKLDKMSISAELEMSFLAGLIKVSGSADFYRDSVVFENEEVFNMAYQATTHTLYMPSDVDVDNKMYCTQKDVSHVVSSVTYGLNAFFTFKKTTSNSKEKQEIQGTLQAMVKSIPSFSIEGKASLKVEGIRKNVFDQTKVSLNGDFLLAHSPTTFAEAIKAYKQITGLLTNTDSSNAQIVEVQLSPIQDYCTNADVVLVKISKQAMETVTETLNNLEITTNKVETLLNSRAAKQFLPVRKNLDFFRNALKQFQNKLKSKLITILPAIKGNDGQKSEKDLILMLNEYYASPYSKDKSDAFLSSRNREIEALNYLLDHFKSDSDNVIVSDYHSANDVEIFLKNPKVVVFGVNILVKAITERYLAGNLNETAIWFNKDEEVKKVGSLVDLFKDFANSNKGRAGFAYLIKVNERTLIPTSIRANKQLFEIPHHPSSLKLKFCSYNTILFTNLNKPNNTWITGFTVSYWKTAEGDMYKKESTFKFSNNDIIINGLEPATAYQFIISFETDFGRSAPSAEADIIFTRPSSPPSNLQMKLQTESSITVSWNAPVFIRTGLKIDSYSAKIFDESKKAMIQVTVNNHEAIFYNLKAYKQYFVEVVAQINNTISNPGQLKVFTSPPSPTVVTVKNISLNTVTIQWVKPNILNLTTGIEYIVRYTMMDLIGKYPIVGTEKTVTALTQPITEINALAEGTYYQFQVKVVTLKGSSNFSPIVTAKTNFQQTKLDKLKENIYVGLIKPGIANLKIEIAANVSNLMNRMMGNQNFAARMRTDITAVRQKVQDLWKRTTSCPNDWAVGDGTGGNGEIFVGNKANAGECIKACKEKKKTYPEINGVTYRASDGNCNCERGMTGHNGRTNYKHCYFS